MLQDVLVRERAAIVAEWYERVLAGYPDEAAGFLRSQSDRFANPVGAGLREALGPLYDGLVEGVGCEQLAASLDTVIRVRAVQEMAPSRAVGFLLELKPIIERRLTVASDDERRELRQFEERIDRLVLAAFDVYTGCREQVCEIRVRAIRDRSLTMIERLNQWRARGHGSGGSDVVDPQ
jgi:hypothetical protein